MKFLSELMISKVLNSRIRNPGTLSFICNICGASCEVIVSTLSREEVSCKSCGSTVRMRSMIYALALALYGRPVILPNFEINMNILGKGMSDWDGYAKLLAKKVGYTNTYYHQEPRLDITDISPKDFESLDFLLSTDVFEHVYPPVSSAFLNAKKMLKPSGSFVFSVPYILEGETIEHFPDLNEFCIEIRGDKKVLINKTKDGRVQEYSDLVFHGSSVGGETLEMRVFSEAGLVRELTQAGFLDVQIMKSPYFEYGIYWSNPWSVPVIAKTNGVPLDIIDWGPRSISVRKPANLQENDRVGLWIKIRRRGVASSLQLKVGEWLVEDGFVDSPELITAFIPSEVMQFEGSKAVTLTDVLTGVTHYIGSLTISA